MAKWAARIPSGFPSLLRRLGLSIPFSADVGFDLTGNVLPVSIVDPDPLTIIAEQPLFTSPFTAGVLAAPAIGVRLADTGPISLPDVNVQILIAALTAAQSDCEIARRNAADAADVWSVAIIGTASTTVQFSQRMTFAAGERLVVRMRTAPGGTYQGAIWLS